MKNSKILARWPVGLLVAALAIIVSTGCKSTTSSSSASTAQPTPAPAPVAAPAAPPAAPAVAPVAAAVAPPATGSATVPPPVRIKAGPGDSFKDADGNTWLTDQGFADGDTIERPDVQIAGTKSPAIYRSERYSMTSFSYPVPNGKYTVKLHFCETFDGITDKGQRVFSFNVEGQDFKDFDVWVKAGGFLRAYVETVNVQVTDGKLDIKFTSNVENPQINGIEILPNP
ncbi:MAG TPA: malectin [Verrucomicrobiae bacterium]